MLIGDGLGFILSVLLMRFICAYPRHDVCVLANTSLDADRVKCRPQSPTAMDQIRMEVNHSRCRRALLTRAFFTVIALNCAVCSHVLRANPFNGSDQWCKVHQNAVLKNTADLHCELHETPLFQFMTVCAEFILRQSCQSCRHVFCPPCGRGLAHHFGALFKRQTMQCNGGFDLTIACGFLAGKMCLFGRSIDMCQKRLCFARKSTRQSR